MRYVIPTAVAIGVGLITLAGYFVNASQIVNIRLLFTSWATILAALAVLLGLLNLILVHFRRIQAGAQGSIYSLITVAAVVATFVVGALESVRFGAPSTSEPGSITQMLFSSVIIASEAALASLVLFFLVVAAARLLRNKPNRWSLVFLGALLIALVGWLPISGLEQVNSVRDWFLSVPVSAGARGILLGVALGTVMVGLRVFVGIERPYKN
jgi:hypothetical protein